MNRIHHAMNGIRLLFAYQAILASGAMTALPEAVVKS
jgi:hypothetical protein